MYARAVYSLPNDLPTVSQNGTARDAQDFQTQQQAMQATVCVLREYARSFWLSVVASCRVCLTRLVKLSRPMAAWNTGSGPARTKPLSLCLVCRTSQASKAQLIIHRQLSSA